MTDTVEQPSTEAAPAAVSTAKKNKGSPKKAGAKSGKKKASHPPTSQMVTAAIKDLKERGGSSLQAIKKYINTTYGVDAEKMSLFIRKYIKSAVESGELVQTKGKGAAGSFRLGGSEGGAEKKKPVKAKKSAATEKKVTVKKTKPAPAKKKESAPKAKKTKKPPTTPKAPKPKKASPSTSKAKKTTPSKAKPRRATASKKAAAKKK